jgi:ectoine hydroxylase-related dioxygenase (phytanoyl-CoA dioxygenase family)
MSAGAKKAAPPKKKATGKKGAVVSAKGRAVGKPAGWMEDFQDEAQREWLFKLGSQVGALPPRVLKALERGEGDSTCTTCDRGGNLICCSSCPRAFHVGCVDDTTTGDAAWHCPICLTDSSHVHRCMLCGRQGGVGAAGEGRLVPCSRCPRAFHFACLVRGPATMPVANACGGWDLHGRWACPTCCDHADHKAELKAAVATEKELAEAEAVAAAAAAAAGGALDVETLETTVAMETVAGGGGAEGGAAAEERGGSPDDEMKGGAPAKGKGKGKAALAVAKGKAPAGPAAAAAAAAAAGGSAPRVKALLRQIEGLCAELPPSHYGSLFGTRIGAIARLEAAAAAARGKSGKVSAGGSAGAGVLSHVVERHALGCAQSAEAAQARLSHVVVAELDAGKGGGAPGGSKAAAAAALAAAAAAAAGGKKQGKKKGAAAASAAAAPPASSKRAGLMTATLALGSHPTLEDLDALEPLAVTDVGAAASGSAGASSGVGAARHLDAATLRRVTQFHQLGMCALPKAIPPAVAEAAADRATEHFEDCLHTVNQLGMQDVLGSEGFDTFKMRDAGRYDMVVPDFVSPPEEPAVGKGAKKIKKSAKKPDAKTEEFECFTSKAPWLPLVRAILGPDAVCINSGVIMSFAGSVNQMKHSDGDHLHDDKQLPSHCLNVFVPLVDLTAPIGPTEFWPTSHTDWETPLPPVTVLAKAGQALLFDYRLKHRGLANHTPDVRPLVYITYAKKWFKDRWNFSATRYTEMPPLTKRSSREDRAKKRRGELAAEGDGGHDPLLAAAKAASLRAAPQPKKRKAPQQPKSQAKPAAQAAKKSKPQPPAATAAGSAASVPPPAPAIAAIADDAPVAEAPSPAAASAPAPPVAGADPL